MLPCYGGAMPTKIITVHGRKGGVGKSMLAYELAYLLDAPLVDFEWDEGSASRRWGYRHQDRVSAPILDAFTKGRTPKPLKGSGKPDLVPGHPDLVALAPSPEEVADALQAWAGEWGTDFVVVDTHPGWNAWSEGASSVAHVVVTPTPLRTMDLEALAGMVDEMPDYPLVVVPNMIPRFPDAGGRARLARIIEGKPIIVANPIPAVNAVGVRRKRIAMTAEEHPAKALLPVVERLQELANLMRTYPL